MSRTFFCFLLLVVLLSTNVAFAQIGRCKGKIIKVGVSKQFVINNCGQPDNMETYTLGARSGSTVAETLYYYDVGWTYIVEIRRGKVSKITKERR
jgi:hypothetical protein